MRLSFWTLAFGFVCLSTSFCTEELKEENTETLGSTPHEQALGDVSFEKGSESKILDHLQGIVVCDYKAKVPRSFLENTRGIQSYDLGFSKHQNIALASHLSRFIGKPLSEQALMQIKRETVLFYRDIGRPVVMVSVPEQDITESVLTIHVLESRAGKVKVSGGSWFSNKSYEKSIRLKSGDKIRSDILVEDLSWINRNPFRSADVVFSPSNSIGVTDVEIIATDQAPLRIFVGADNTGFSSTQYDRIFTGCTVGRVFGSDSILNYQMSASPNFSQYIAHSAHYTTSLPWRHLLVFYGGYATVHPKLPSGLNESHGHAIQVSSRYEIPCAPGGGQLHAFRLGADYKRSNNDILTGGITVSKSSVNLFQIMMGYSMTLEQKRGNTLFEAEVFLSPGQTFPHMNDQLYGNFRTHSESLYGYGRLAMRRTFFLKNRMSFLAKMENQIAFATVPPSETAPLGGWDSVRGYDERELQTDNAVVMTLEAKAPAAHLIRYRYRKKRFEDRIIFLAFVDFGFGMNYYDDDGNRDFGYQKVASMGPGFRYQLADWLSARFDFGFQLVKAPDESKRGRKAHFSVTCSY